MGEHLEHRLNQLKAEFESGQKMLADLKTRQKNLKETLLRIISSRSHPMKTH